ncbi:hypothetical protein TNIN_455341 [Trichonephila inaurata madagascariensis]|uniref:Uncharacterized protein n=1 Tax=Trichonephila inaurata madagascariensis TaxID=2747483 RepID=A0A8X6X5C5_9ARAC|nr:hypothetical protein TNIN_455341 [Trichonephila inaurata madagascariensis]
MLFPNSNSKVKLQYPSLDKSIKPLTVFLWHRARTTQWMHKIATIKPPDRYLGHQGLPLCLFGPWSIVRLLKLVPESNLSQTTMIEVESICPTLPYQSVFSAVVDDSYFLFGVFRIHD